MWKAFKNHSFVYLLFLFILVVAGAELIRLSRAGTGKTGFLAMNDSTWMAPSLFLDKVPDKDRDMVLYGEELIINTSKYFGPKGSIAAITNGMNCQNCHLDAGKLPWGNNYGAVASTYPKFRERSGSMETISKRVNDCFERSLNGRPIDSNSKEMKAIYAYMKWLGKDVPKNVKPHGAGLEKLPYLDRAADPDKGRIVYNNHCIQCHGNNGEGQLNIDSSSFTTPPLWGPKSYNDAAGLYRISNFASFVKNNMPFRTASHDNAILTNEEAWDVAAYINSQNRPKKDQSRDWPDINKKPADLPVPPFADTFSVKQHKYGPFSPIIWYQQEMNRNKKRT